MKNVLPLTVHWIVIFWQERKRIFVVDKVHIKILENVAIELNWQEENVSVRNTGEPLSGTRDKDPKWILLLKLSLIWCLRQHGGKQSLSWGTENNVLHGWVGKASSWSLTEGNRLHLCASVPLLFVSPPRPNTQRGMGPPRTTTALNGKVSPTLSGREKKPGSDGHVGSCWRRADPAEWKLPTRVQERGKGGEVPSRQPPTLPVFCFCLNQIKNVFKQFREDFPSPHPFNSLSLLCQFHRNCSLTYCEVVIQPGTLAKG